MSASRTSALQSDVFLQIQAIAEQDKAIEDKSQNNQGFSLNQPFTIYTIRQKDVSYKLMVHVNSETGKWGSARIYIHGRTQSTSLRQAISIKHPAPLSKLIELFQSQHAHRERMFETMYIRKINWAKESVREVYDLTKGNENTRSHYSKLYNQYNDILSKLARIEGTFNLVDAGCGDGEFVKQLMQQAWFNQKIKYLGFDYNLKNVEILQSIPLKQNYIVFQQGDIHFLQDILNQAKQNKQLDPNKKIILLCSGILTRLVLKNAFESIDVLQQAWLAGADHIILGGMGEILLTYRMAKQCGYTLEVIDGVVHCQRGLLENVLSNKSDKIKKQHILDLSLSPEPFVWLNQLLKDKGIRDLFQNQAITIDLSYSRIGNQQELQTFKQEVMDCYPNTKIIFCSQHRDVIDVFKNIIGERLIRAQYTPTGEALLVAPTAAVDVIMGPFETFQHLLPTERSPIHIRELLKQIDPDAIPLPTDSYETFSLIKYCGNQSQHFLSYDAMNVIDELNPSSFGPILEIILNEKPAVLARLPLDIIAKAIISAPYPKQALETLCSAGLDPMREHLTFSSDFSFNLLGFLYGEMCNNPTKNFENLLDCIALLLEKSIQNDKNGSLMECIMVLEDKWKSYFEWRYDWGLAHLKQNNLEFGKKLLSGMAESFQQRIDFFVRCAVKAGVDIDKERKNECATRNFAALGGNRLIDLLAEAKQDGHAAICFQHRFFQQSVSSISVPGLVCSNHVTNKPII